LLLLLPPLLNACEAAPPARRPPPACLCVCLQDAHNLLRPEAVESFYLLWKVTGHPRYRQWAWQVFRALDKWARVRPQDRQRRCATCQAQAAHEAAQAAKVAAAAALEAAVAAEAAAAAAAAAVSCGEEGQVDEALEQAGSDDAAAACQLLQQRRRGARGPEFATRWGDSRAACSACSSSGGFSSLESVLQAPPQRRDKMESFFLSETLKYLYLIFAEPPDRCLHPSCHAGAQQAQHGAGHQQAQHDSCGGSSSGGRSSDSSSGGGSDGGSGADGSSSGWLLGQRRLLPLDRFVLTTEAHVLPIVGPAAASTVQPCLPLGSPLLRPFDVAVGRAAAAGSCAASGSSLEEEQQEEGGGGAGSSGFGVEEPEEGQEEAAIDQILHQLADAVDAMAAAAGAADAIAAATARLEAAVEDAAAVEGHLELEQEAAAALLSADAAAASAAENAAEL
jgi:mannosyl-oligosaccharide alpha-1,2-mannosidase